MYYTSIITSSFYLIFNLQLSIYTLVYTLMVVAFILYMEHIFGHRKIIHCITMVIIVFHSSHGTVEMYTWCKKVCKKKRNKQVKDMHRLTYIRGRASMNVSMQHCQNQDPTMNLFQKACSTFAVQERDFEDAIVSQTSNLDIYVVSCLHTSKKQRQIIHM